MKGPRDGRRRIVFVLAALLLPGTAVAQQARPYIGAGYVASAPELFGGGAVYGVLPGLLGGLGLYADAKFDLDRPTEEPGYEPGVTATEVEAELGDEFFRSEDVWYNINAALMRPVSQNLVIYLGAGYASLRRYNEYQDDDASGDLGFGNFYWVEDTEVAETAVNLLGGAFIRLGGSVFAQFGAERHPKGLTVGLSYLLPL